MADEFTPPTLYPEPRIAEGVVRDHPAYRAIFQAYAEGARSPKRALSIVAAFWDPDAFDADLPDDKTVGRWAKQDQWDPAIDEWSLGARNEINEVVNTALLTSAPNAVRVLNEIANGEFEDPKAANVRQNAAYKLLTLASAGILGVRYGELPVNNAAQQKAVKAIRAMTPEQVLEMRRKAIQSETDG